MKRLGLYAATAIVAFGVSSAAAIPAQANISSFTICSPGSSMGSNCSSLQDLLSSLSYSCPTMYSCSNSSNNCFNAEKYFSNQGCTQNSLSGNNCFGNSYFGNSFPDFFFQGNNCQGNNCQGNVNPGNNNQGIIIPGNNNQGNINQGSVSVDTSSNTAYIQQIVNLVNEERAKAGLSPVTESSALSKAAYTRAQEITRNFSHTRPNGSYFSSILQQNGISYISSGENIAYGQRTPQEVMNGWMNSSSHRANILNPNYTTIGVGFYQDSNGTNYWSQLFIR